MSCGCVRRDLGFFIWMGCMCGTNKNCLDEGYTLTGSPRLIDSEIKAIVYPHLSFACGLLLYILPTWIIVTSWNYKSTVEWAGVETSLSFDWVMPSLSELHHMLFSVMGLLIGYIKNWYLGVDITWFAMVISNVWGKSVSYGQDSFE